MVMVYSDGNVESFQNTSKGCHGFLAHGLRNVSNIFLYKIHLKKNSKVGPSKCDQSWFFDLMVCCHAHLEFFFCKS
jgi:hypothetical protein